MTYSRTATPDAGKGRRLATAARGSGFESSRKAPSYPFQRAGDLRLSGNLADGANRRHGGGRSKHGGARFANLFDGDRIDARQHLVEGKRAPVDVDLARELVNARRGLLEGGHQRDLHLRLGAANLRFLKPVRGF